MNLRLIICMHVDIICIGPNTKTKKVASNLKKDLDTYLLSFLLTYLLIYWLTY